MIKQALQVVLYYLVSLQLANGEKSPLHSIRKYQSGSCPRSRNAAFLFSGISARSSERVMRTKPSLGTIVRRYTSLQFKIELFTSAFGNGLKKETSDQQYRAEIDEVALPSWAEEDLASPEKVGKLTELLMILNSNPKKMFNAEQIKKFVDKKEEKDENKFNRMSEETLTFDTEISLINLMKVNDLIANERSSTISEKTNYNADNKGDDEVESIKDNKESLAGQNLLDISTVEELLDWDNFVLALQSSIKDLVESSTPNASFGLSTSTEHIVKEASQQIESIPSDASKSFSPEKLDKNADVFKMMESLVATAEAMAIEQGLDVSEAAKQARETTDYTAKFFNAANGVLLSGYVRGGLDKVDFIGELAKGIDIPIPGQPEAVKPLFGAYNTARSIPKAEYHQTVEKGAEMAELAGAMYSDPKLITDKLGYAIVANGTTADVVWMVTDSIGYEEDYLVSSSDQVTERIPTLIRTVTVRGYDASDETVDRERLLNRLCTANPVLLGEGNKNVFFHGGLLDVAEELYLQISPLIQLAGPTHKIVFNGHSIGGSLAILLLFLLTEHHGDTFVREKVLRTFTFGSIPVAFFAGTANTTEDIDCPILRSYGLPASMIYGYVQPWDPIARLFSPIDAMYPLVDDLGEDGVSLYASGPNRALRPIIRSILESWEGWPTLRTNLLGSAVVQDYESIGIQHLLLPDPSRYLTDRLLTVNVGAPPLEEVIRISPVELYSALEDIFPLDTFSISYVPAAVRSFIHHFFPAYEQGLKNYVERETIREKILAEV